MAQTSIDREALKNVYINQITIKNSKYLFLLKALENHERKIIDNLRGNLSPEELEKVIIEQKKKAKEELKELKIKGLIDLELDLEVL